MQASPAGARALIDGSTHSSSLPPSQSARQRALELGSSSAAKDLNLEAEAEVGEGGGRERGARRALSEACRASENINGSTQPPLSLPPQRLAHKLRIDAADYENKPIPRWER